MWVCERKRSFIHSFIHACIHVQAAQIKNGLWNTPWHIRIIDTLSTSCLPMSLSQRKLEIIFPVQTNGPWLCETGLKLKWSEKLCAFAFKSIWPAKAPFSISKTKQLQPITSIHFMHAKKKMSEWFCHLWQLQMIHWSETTISDSEMV